MSAGVGFPFGGATLYRPGILVSSTFGSQRILQLLPVSTVCFVGATDRGAGSGKVYQFSDTGPMVNTLGGGPAVTAALDACALGGVSDIVVVDVGLKVGASLVLGSNNATLTASPGQWGNGATVTIVAGTSSGHAVTFTWPSVSGQTIVYGGKGSTFDNLANYSNLQTAILADPLLTPPASTGYPAVFTLAVTTDAAIANLSTAPLTGGYGTSGYVNTVVAASPSPTTTTCGVQDATNISVGSVIWIGTRQAKITGVTGTTLTFVALAGAPTAGQTVVSRNDADFEAGIDALALVAYDVGHAVQAYDSAVWAYWDSAVIQQYPFGRFHRLIHQVPVSNLSPTGTDSANSALLAAAGVSAANTLNSFRSSVSMQQLLIRDTQTGGSRLQDGAVLVVGDAALQGATGQWGPATPLTFDAIATSLDLPYRVLDTTGDMTSCIQNGVIVFEVFGQRGSAGSVRIVQSLTTSPNDPQTGAPWLFRELSVVRVSDALLANVKAQVETATPKIIGGGNTVRTMSAVVAAVQDILELAMNAQWITQYDPASIVIAPTGTLGTDDIVRYSASPTVPLNHLGIGQTLLPYEVQVSVGGVVNG